MSDYFIDLFLSVVLVLISPMGDFSSVAFIYLIIFRSKKYLLLSSLLCLSICVGLIINGWSLQNTFALATLYGLMNYKYYYIIHKPVELLRAQLSEANRRLSIIGPVEQLTNDQIIQKYPFMHMPGEDKYRRIRDLRMLSDGSSCKEIAVAADVDPNTISREFNDLKINIGVFTDQKITSKEQLVKVCIELGIVQVNFIHR